jgi:hypothetical protein
MAAKSPGVSRRAVLGWGLALTAAPVLGWLGWHEFADDGSTTTTTVTDSGAAEDLAASFGVVIHLHFESSVYGDSHRVIQQIADLGARHVRSRLALQPEVHASFAQLASNGTQVHGVCGAFGDPQTMHDIMSSVAQSYADPQSVFSAFEGINEPNNNGVPWISETRTKTHDLFVARNQFGLDAVPIVAPALARVASGGVQGKVTQTQSANLGDLRPWIDKGNIHVYPRGLKPSTDLDEFITWERQVCGHDPIYNTESGYFTAVNYSGGSFPVSEDAARQYVPRLVMENWIRGIRRFFLYELLDDVDASGANREAHFGMLSVSGSGPGAVWTPKPHYEAMKNFLNLLGDRGAGSSGANLTCTLRGGPDLRSTMVSKSNGFHYLCLWRDVNVYDPVSRRDLTVAPRSVKVDLPSVATVTEYRPSSSATAVATVPNVSTFSVPIAGELHICEIVPRSV